jgi:hypothetical protein
MNVMTKSDMGLAEERVKRLRKDVELFQSWFELGGGVTKKYSQKGKEYSFESARIMYFSHHPLPLLVRNGWRH